MRRKDREITDFGEIAKIIEQCDTIRIAMVDNDGMPYIVPLNFGHEIVGEQICFYFHCAGEGKKLDLIRKDKCATFEMDCGHNLLLFEEDMNCTMSYDCVMGHGTIDFIPEEDKLAALKCLMRHYRSEDFRFNPAMVPVTTVLKFTVTDYTAKRRCNKQ